MEKSEDGRVARGQRTREAVIDTLFELYCEGNLTPTIEQIAERIGRTSRAIYQHFQDKEALAVAMAERQLAIHGELYRATPIVGDVDQRIRGIVTHRSTLFEAVAPRAPLSARTSPSVSRAPTTADGSGCALSRPAGRNVPVRAQRAQHRLRCRHARPPRPSHQLGDVGTTSHLAGHLGRPGRAAHHPIDQPRPAVLIIFDRGQLLSSWSTLSLIIGCEGLEAEEAQHAVAVRPTDELSGVGHERVISSIAVVDHGDLIRCRPQQTHNRPPSRTRAT